MFKKPRELLDMLSRMEAKNQSVFKDNGEAE